MTYKTGRRITIMDNADTLRRMYVDEHMSVPKIAEEMGVSESTLYRRLRDHGIERRGKGGRDDDFTAEQLESMYHDHEMSTREIAVELEVNYKVVLRRMDEHGIERRDRLVASIESTSHKERTTYGPGWNETKRQAARDRHGNKCFICNRSSDEHYQQFNCDLHVHHIKPARLIDNASERNALDNLVPLCASCHKRVEHGNLELNK